MPLRQLVLTLGIVACGACTEHGKPPPPAPVVDPLPPPRPVAEAEPAAKTVERVSCTRTAYRIAETWTGEGKSETSLADARASAEAAACKAAGRKAGCLDEEGAKLSVTQSSSSSSVQFINGESRSQHEVSVRLVRWTEKKTVTLASPRGERHACEVAKYKACHQLGEDDCPRERVMVSDPPASAHPFFAGESNQPAN